MRPTGVVLIAVYHFMSALFLVMLAIGFAFFAISIGYVYACDRL